MTKKPVPLWIKIILLFTVAVLISSTLLFPSLVETFMAYERGRVAEQEGRYSTAIKEYEQVLKQFPDSDSIIARLAISYFQNERIAECSELLGRIAGSEVSGRLSRQVNEIVGKMNSIYYESKELSEALELYGQEELEKTAGKLERNLSAKENDVMCIFHLANINFDMGEYADAEKLYLKAIELQPEFYSAYLNLAAAYRETGQLEAAVECCNKVLNINKEHPQAFTALSKIELKGDNYKAALEYAKKAYEYDSGDLNIISNLCMVYNYNKMTADRDKLFEILKQNNYYDAAALQSIFDGK